MTKSNGKGHTCLAVRRLALAILLEPHVDCGVVAAPGGGRGRRYHDQPARPLRDRRNALAPARAWTVATGSPLLGGAGRFRRFPPAAAAARLGRRVALEAELIVDAKPAPGGRPELLHAAGGRKAQRGERYRRRAAPAAVIMVRGPRRRPGLGTASKRRQWLPYRVLVDRRAHAQCLTVDAVPGNGAIVHPAPVAIPFAVDARLRQVPFPVPAAARIRHRMHERSLDLLPVNVFVCER